MLDTQAEQMLLGSADCAADDEPPIVVVGAGPVGMRVAQEAMRRLPDRRLVIFGEEHWRPYNRVMLTPLFAGESRIEQIYTPWWTARDGDGPTLLNRRIVSIDRARRCVTDEYGEIHRYARLVLATGSRPRIPAIPNIDHPGVYTFRNLDDVERLLAHMASSRAAVVIGGGLLGLEAARGLHRRGITTTVIEHERWLMFHQLDPEGGEALRDRVAATGVAVLTGVAVREIHADGGIKAVRLLDGTEIACDTVVVCTGIRPNIELALDAGLRVGRGITVDDSMRTSDPDIFAAGECAEHRDRIYGLVAPGLEQAGVAAHYMAGGTASYQGSIAATKLKVVGVPVFSIGEIAGAEHLPFYRTSIYRNPDDGAYRRVLMSRGRLIGALAIGEWAEINRLQEAVASRRRIGRLALRRFRRTGELWRAHTADSVIGWPAAATVCNCTGVTRGALGAAMERGSASIEALQAETGASTVCGSCRPLLAELIGQPAASTAPAGWRWMLGISVLGLLTSLLVLLATPPAYRHSILQAVQLDLLWTDGLNKQISGFSLLAIGLLAAGLSLRKRWRWLAFGEYASWRVLHTALGAAALLVLVAHTGLHLGEQLNRLLVTSFLAVGLMGAMSGGVMALENRLGARDGARARRLTTWLHILTCWPLPVLLGFHILSVYYF